MARQFEPLPGSDERRDADLLRDRRGALDRAMRQRLGFWRRLGRSNRLFPRKLVVTTEGRWIIALSLLLGVAAINTGNNLLYLILSLLISIITISGILSELALRGVEVERAYPHQLAVGEVALLRVAVRNAKRRAAYNIEVVEVVDADGLTVRPGYVLHLEGHEIGQAFLQVRANRRGPIATAGLQVSTSYPFGFARKARFLAEPARLLALPATDEVVLTVRGGLGRGHEERSRRVGRGSELLGLRDVRPGDGLRDIHWKVSARRDRLIAREWEAEATRVAIVRFVHLGPRDPDLAADAGLDRACGQVAGLCRALLDRGLAVSLQTFAGHVPAAMDSEGQAGQLGAIRRHLAHLVPADHPPVPHWALDDGPWLSLSHRNAAVWRALAEGVPLPWPRGAFDAGAEVWRVDFVDRLDVPMPWRCDAQVVLERDGTIRSMHEASSDSIPAERSA